MEKIGFIGCGHLAKALIDGLSNFKKYKIHGHDRNEANQNWLQANGHQALSLEDAIINSDVVIICVKPKDVIPLCDDMKQHISLNKKVVSVAAGIKYRQIKDRLEDAKIFRAMPNIGSKDNLGITSIFSREESSDIVELFKHLGEAFIVEDEDQIDLHTSLIGSGPAFFLEIINEFEKRFEDIIDSIKSKGGTTEAGLNHLYSKDFTKVFSEAVDAAVHRAKELSMD
jgi:pyrroline-5-carboxylate reductase